MTSTQVYKVISPVVRKNLTHLFVFGLRNANDLEAWIEKLSAVYDKKTLHQLYNRATEAPHIFYVSIKWAKLKKIFFFNRIRTTE